MSEDQVPCEWLLIYPDSSWVDTSIVLDLLFFSDWQIFLVKYNFEEKIVIQSFIWCVVTFEKGEEMLPLLSNCSLDLYQDWVLYSTENCALLDYYAACSCITLPTFRYNLSVPLPSWSLKTGPIGYTETLERSYSYHYKLRSRPEERSSRLRSGGSLKSLFGTVWDEIIWHEYG